jgi:DNA adenine methylase
VYQGGKTRLLKQILPLFPESFNNYFEPFIGGGAVCFSRLPPNANISDLDPVVAGVYQDIKDNYEEVAFWLGVFGNMFIEFGNDVLAPEVIDILNSDADRPIISALFILATRCCFRGMVKRDGTRFIQQKFYKRITERALLRMFSNVERLHRYHPQMVHIIPFLILSLGIFKQ